LYSSGSGEVQAVASTEHGKHKCNTVHFLHNYITSAVLNTNWLHDVYFSIFQLQFLAIFMKLVVLLLCAVYMSMYLVRVWRYDYNYNYNYNIRFL